MWRPVASLQDVFALGTRAWVGRRPRQARRPRGCSRPWTPPTRSCSHSTTVWTTLASSYFLFCCPIIPCDAFVLLRQAPLVRGDAQILPLFRNLPPPCAAVPDPLHPFTELPLSAVLTTNRAHSLFRCIYYRHKRDNLPRVIVHTRPLHSSPASTWRIGPTSSLKNMCLTPTRKRRRRHTILTSLRPEKSRNTRSRLGTGGWETALDPAIQVSDASSPTGDSCLVEDPLCGWSGSIHEQKRAPCTRGNIVWPQLALEAATSPPIESAQ